MLKLIRVLTALVVALAVLALVPQRLVGQNSDALFRGDRGEVLPLADHVADSINSGVTTEAFSTGSKRFDGEWAFGTHQMAVLGLSQVLLANPSDAGLADRYLPAIRKASAVLLAPKTRAFGTEAWGSDALESLDELDRDAWLGYVALALSVHRQVDPDFPFVEVHDKIVSALRKRIEANPTGLFETYPNETYPVDVSASVAAIKLHGILTGENISEFVANWFTLFNERYIDSNTGYLMQATDGTELGVPRGSGTSLAAYFVGFADSTTAANMFRALRKEGDRNLFGFSTIREFPRGVDGSGDIDSGPVIFGSSVSATGFTLASARRFGDRKLFRRLNNTASLWGVPYSAAVGRGHAIGGPLGDAILLAMYTARIEASATNSSAAK
jgi:hypothetical protein